MESKGGGRACASVPAAASTVMHRGGSGRMREKTASLLQARAASDAGSLERSCGQAVAAKLTGMGKPCGGTEIQRGR